MILLIPINGVLANATKKLQIQQMKYKDKRVKMMNEILSGIKVISWINKTLTELQCIIFAGFETLRLGTFFPSTSRRYSNQRDQSIEEGCLP